MRYYGICLALALTFAAMSAEAAPFTLQGQQSQPSPPTKHTEHTPSPPYFLVHVLF